MPPPIIHVAVGILQNAAGEILLASRPPDKPWPGYWEFPGGKIETGESAHTALLRELKEELGITVKHATPWISLFHHYPATQVHLHCFLVDDWEGEPHPHEGQKLCWQSPFALTVTPLLPANLTLLRALRLPTIMGITPENNDPATFLPQFDHALSQGLRLIQLRDASLPPPAAQTLIEHAQARGAKIVINSAMPYASTLRANGIHLTAAQLHAQHTRPPFPLVGASCHNAAELDKAESLGCDYALLSPVLPTPTHPGAPHLGWTEFTRQIQGRSMPIYALGGMQAEMLPIAKEHGAHGIALLRSAWQ